MRGAKKAKKCDAGKKISLWSWKFLVLQRGGIGKAYWRHGVGVGGGGLDDIIVWFGNVFNVCKFDLKGVWVGFEACWGVFMCYEMVIGLETRFEGTRDFGLFFSGQERCFWDYLVFWVLVSGHWLLVIPCFLIVRFLQCSDMPWSDLKHSFKPKKKKTYTIKIFIECRIQIRIFYYKWRDSTHLQIVRDVGVGTAKAGTVPR